VRSIIAAKRMSKERSGRRADACPPIQDPTIPAPPNRSPTRQSTFPTAACRLSPTRLVVLTTSKEVAMAVRGSRWST